MSLKEKSPTISRTHIRNVGHTKEFHTIVEISLRDIYRRSVQCSELGDRIIDNVTEK
jgi:hypothetical protein